MPRLKNISVTLIVPADTGEAFSLAERVMLACDFQSYPLDTDKEMKNCETIIGYTQEHDQVHFDRHEVHGLYARGEITTTTWWYAGLWDLHLRIEPDKDISSQDSSVWTSISINLHGIAASSKLLAGKVAAELMTRYLTDFPGCRCEMDVLKIHCA